MLGTIKFLRKQFFFYRLYTDFFLQYDKFAHHTAKLGAVRNQHIKTKRTVDRNVFQNSGYGIVFVSELDFFTQRILFAEHLPGKRTGEQHICRLL